MTQPKKRFGQHFLQDQNVIERILNAFSPKNHDHIIEIGPGQGALTYPLLKRVDQLEAVELDRDLVPILQNRAAEMKKALLIHSENVLKVDFSQLKKDERLLRIIGNLPYNISTPLIFHLLSFTNIISDMVFMLQKEVAHRMSAKPDSEEYGRLSVMVQYYCEVECLFDVPPSAFYPPPKVESTIILMRPFEKKPYLAKDITLFSDIVLAAFNQRRKTLRNGLKNYIDESLWEKINISSQLRPENLSVEHFVAISNALSEKST